MVSIDFDVTNKFQHDDKFANILSENNRDLTVSPIHHFTESLLTLYNILVFLFTNILFGLNLILTKLS